MLGRRLKVCTGDYDNMLKSHNLEYLSQRRESALLEFGVKLLKSDKFRTMIPNFNKNIRHHSLRRHNLLVPVNCSKVRYKRSTIPALVDLLNQEYRQHGSLRGLQFLDVLLEENTYN